MKKMSFIALLVLSLAANVVLVRRNLTSNQYGN